MKTIRLLVGLVILAGLIQLSSCSKKNDPVPLTTTQLLTQNTWKLTNVTYAGSAIPGATFTGELLFKTDNTYSFSLTATVTGMAPIVANETGTWTLATDEKSLTMTPNGTSGSSGGLTLTSEIITLDAANLKFNQSVSGVEIVYTFVKK